MNETLDTWNIIIITVTPKEQKSDFKKYRFEGIIDENIEKQAYIKPR